MQKDKKNETQTPENAPCPQAPAKPAKIMFSSNSPHLNAEIGDRLGTAPYLLFVDPANDAVEALPNPGTAGGRGGGLQAAALAIERGAHVVVTGYCSPSVERFFQAQGIQVIQRVKGTVSEWMQGYLASSLDQTPVSERPSWRVPLKQSIRQFYGTLPPLLGVIGLIGLFNAYVPKRQLLTIFTGRNGLDTFLGTCLGSILAGNPINSYVIGGSLLKSGVSLYAVTAFMVAWVSVGLIQLPMEVESLGHQFALLRNLLTFLITMGVAFMTVACVHVF